ncbi:MAG: IPT/TIG domain-containing protein [Nannocystis sp.]|uniref:IPT/TIG domain-containing protein n=1 Tax=Nannocystis sp. TaxID=1962667 RepID=UPI002425D34A|nr:IPT/TIG domain-containing protein [Nannocystis sp.]MBK9757902.1 IPT/TIG domain-containing protein [Nannocystis sp.]
MVASSVVAVAMLFAGPQRARAAEIAAVEVALNMALDGDPPAAAAAPTIASVSPAEFAAGATITISGQSFAEGDVLLLDSHALTDLKITPTSITGTVPATAKAGKKLVLKRAKKQVATFAASSEGMARFTFVPAPKLSGVTPKFAAPGETVTLKGKGLARVSELSLGGAKLKIDEQTDIAIKFTAVDGNHSGPLAVKSIGGEAALKKDYEVFYAPTLASVDPPAAFEGDAITLKGTHLAAPVKFKLGSKSLKLADPADQTETSAKLVVPKAAKSGPLAASARGKKASLGSDFIVHPTPVLSTVPKEVGAPGELKVSGKHLDAVTTWRLGQVTLTPVAAATASKVTLTVPADAPIDQPLIAVTQGREFTSKKPVATVKTPIVQGLAFWTGPDGKGVDGVIRGADFSEKTKFTLAGKPLSTSFVAADRVGFTLAKAPPASAQKLSAKAGKYAGAPIEVDGAGNGYRVPADQLAALLPTGLQNYDLVAAQLDLEVSTHLVGEAEGAAQQNAEAARVAALGLRLAQDLQRVSLAQAALCGAMTSGKDATQTAKNAAAGELLRQSNRHSQTLLATLEKLWSNLGPDAIASAGLAEVDAAVASVGAAQPKLVAACKGRFAGSGKLISDAATTVKLDVDKLYRAPILAAFEDVLARGKNWSAVEKDVEGRLAVLPSARKKLWFDTLKASKAGVEAAAAGVTGKGAKGDKHVEKQDKPKGTGKGGKGKAN